MRKLLRYARQAAQSPGPILLRGEEEVGKAQLAEAIHFGSEQAAGPLVTLNCQALPSERMALELMGSDEAGQERAGKFELAHGGTLVLEQVECLSAPMQAALLQLLKTYRLQRFDSARILPLKVRIIATSSAALEQKVQEGHFTVSCSMRCRRASCGCRACVSALPICPASSASSSGRRGASQGASSVRRPSTACSPTPGPATWGAAQCHRACPASLQPIADPARGATTAIRHGHQLVADEVVGQPLLTLAELERQAILRCAHACKGQVSQMAQQLGIYCTTLWRRLKLLEIDPANYHG